MNVVSTIYLTSTPFVSPQNFLDPEKSKNGEPYGPFRFKEIIRELYLISKFTNTSYTDLQEITPAEKNHLLYIISEDKAQEDKIQKEIIEKSKK